VRLNLSANALAFSIDFDEAAISYAPSTIFTAFAKF
jgi:hypothetical protein